MPKNFDDIYAQNEAKEKLEASLRSAAAEEKRILKAENNADAKSKARSATNQSVISVGQSFAAMMQSGKNPNKALASFAGFSVSVIKLAFTAAAEIRLADKLNPTSQKPVTELKETSAADKSTEEKNAPNIITRAPVKSIFSGPSLSAGPNGLA